MYREAGRRVPAILTVTTGAEATATGGGVATERVVQQGDLVLTDTSPWIDGALVGHRECGVRRDARPGRRGAASTPSAARSTTASRSVAPGPWPRTSTASVRELLAEHGPTYPHHTGHGIGAAWSEEPRITPYNDMRIEEGMVLALEPAIYAAGLGRHPPRARLRSSARATTRS